MKDLPKAAEQASEGGFSYSRTLLDEQHRRALGNDTLIDSGNYKERASELPRDHCTNAVVKRDFDTE